MPTGSSNTDRDPMCKIIFGVMDIANTTMFMTEAHLGLAFVASIYQCPLITNFLRRILRFVWLVGIIGGLLVQWTAVIEWTDEVGCGLSFPNEGNEGYVYIAVYSIAIIICSMCYIMSYAKMQRANFAVQSKVRHRARGFLVGWLLCESINYIRLLDGYGRDWDPHLIGVAIALKCLSPLANAYVYLREGGFLARIMSRKRTRDESSTPRPSRSFNVAIGEATIVEYNASASSPRLADRNVLAWFDPVQEENEDDADSVQFEEGS